MNDARPADEFVSWRSYWRFAHSVRSELRYLHSEETRRFLEAVRITSESRYVGIPFGQTFWRAQIGHDWQRFDDVQEDEIPCPFPPARMKPLSGRASDGRANPRGISYLYMADSQQTAISEVRPWIGSSVSVGQFLTTRQLRVVDCSRYDGSTPIFFEEPDRATRLKAVWADIDGAFAQPMTRSDDHADYVPTQILAELFKQEGLDGIVYRSNFGGGKNVVLFNLNDAALRWCGLFDVSTVDLQFRMVANPYAVTAAD